MFSRPRRQLQAMLPVLDGGEDVAGGEGGVSGQGRGDDCHETMGGPEHCQKGSVNVNLFSLL